ncbi:hypothetical protein R84981_000327 [Carnimonas sp. R-84981]|uniref:MFS transporter n=1 Tax=Carnimonas bestiolae TaxID=3402172 RepID=UPI003EDC6EEB
MVESTARTSHPAAHSPSTTRVSRLFILLYWLADIGIFLAVMTPVSITMAIRVADLFPDHKAAYLGIILGVGSLGSMIANPVCGYLSDLTRTRWGRRRPWILSGMCLATLALWGLGVATSLLALVAFWCLAQVAINAALASLVAVIPDQVPKQQRGFVSALHSMSTTLAIMAGVVVINIVGTAHLGMFLIPALIGLACTLIFVCFFKEPLPDALPPKEHRLLDIKSAMLKFRRHPFSHSPFSLAWLNTFLLFFGSSMVGAYQVYFLTDRLGFDAVAVARGIFISTAVTGACVVMASSLTGWLSDRLDRRKPFVIGAILLFALGVLLLMLTHNYWGFLLAVTTTSLGSAIYAAVDQAMVIDVLPDQNTSAGKNMGIFNMAVMAPQVISPIVAPWFLGMGEGHNFNALFGAAMVVVLASLIPIFRMRGVR